MRKIFSERIDKEKIIRYYAHVEKIIRYMRKTSTEVEDTNIKQIREAAGVTQHELAAALEIDRTTVSKWEVGAAKPRAELLPALAAALHCTINDLFAVEQ